MIGIAEDFWPVPSGMYTHECDRPRSIHWLERSVSPCYYRWPFGMRQACYTPSRCPHTAINEPIILSSSVIEVVVCDHVHVCLSLRWRRSRPQGWSDLLRHSDRGQCCTGHSACGTVQQQLRYVPDCCSYRRCSHTASNLWWFSDAPTQLQPLDIRCCIQPPASRTAMVLATWVSGSCAAYLTATLTSFATLTFFNSVLCIDCPPRLYPAQSW